jgi:antitoxin CptB
MTINITDLKKKIIYRSTYRGTKEMDSLLISFTKKYIDKFNESELKDLVGLLNLDDETLYQFNQGIKTSVKIEVNRVTDLFKNHIYKKN